MPRRNPDLPVRRITKLAVACLVVTLAPPQATAAQTPAAPHLATLSLRPHAGVGLIGFSYGGAILVRISEAVGVTLAAHDWHTESGCPDIYPSTCGEDGRSLTAGVRFDRSSTPAWWPFVEGHAGQYRFSELARDGDRTLVLGVRAGIVWFTAPGVELEAAIEVQRMVGYEKGGVSFPTNGIGALQFGVGIPIS